MTAAAAPAALKSVEAVLTVLRDQGTGEGKIERLRRVGAKNPADLLAAVATDRDWKGSDTVKKLGRLVHGEDYQLPVDAGAVSDEVQSLRARVKELERLNRDLDGQVGRLSAEATQARKAYDDLLRGTSPHLTPQPALSESAPVVGVD
jgi:hypothetical protein